MIIRTLRLLLWIGVLFVVVGVLTRRALLFLETPISVILPRIHARRPRTIRRPTKRSDLSGFHQQSRADRWKQRSVTKDEDAVSGSLSRHLQSCGFVLPLGHKSRYAL